MDHLYFLRGVIKSDILLYLYFQGCHLITDFCNRVKNEEARQALMLCVEHHRKVVKGFRKEDLEKC